MLPAPLLGILVALVIVGILLWALGQFPIDPTIAKFIRVIVIVVVAIWVLYLLVNLLGGGAPVFGPYRR
jgi:hypothetical protein